MEVDDDGISDGEVGTVLGGGGGGMSNEVGGSCEADVEGCGCDGVGE
ncbi:hypothetical protein ACQ7OT_11425 [Micrococcus luteus]